MGGAEEYGVVREVVRVVRVVRDDPGGKSGTGWYGGGTGIKPDGGSLHPRHHVLPEHVPCERVQRPAHQPHSKQSTKHVSRVPSMQAPICIQ